MLKTCKDPKMFTVPCIIGNYRFDNVVLDLGAFINVMLVSVYNSLRLRSLHDTGVVIQLANRSNAHPTGLIEDVLVRVNELIFPMDFYILKMEKESSSSKPLIILSRPFLKIARRKIDVHRHSLYGVG